MGFWSGIGKGFKVAGEGIGTLGLAGIKGTGKVGMGVSGKIGSSLISEFGSRPGMVVGAALTGAVAGFGIADQDGQADPGIASLKGAALGLGVSALGGASAMTGLGIAAAGAVTMGANAFGTVGRGMIKAPKGPVGLGNLSDFELNKTTAIPLILGATAIKGISDGIKTFEKSRMGLNDGTMRRATPEMPRADQVAPSYANNAGATGDLVFSMFKNR